MTGTTAWDSSFLNPDAFAGIRDGNREDTQPKPNPIDIKVRHILDTISEPADQIDAIAEARGYFLPDDAATLPTLSAYLSNSLSLRATVSHFADPIDEAYSTAERGRAHWRAEDMNRGQREILARERKYREVNSDPPPRIVERVSPPRSVEEIEELWGEAVALTEPDPVWERGGRSVEGQLWELWFGVLHAARRVDWRDVAAQERLVELVAAFKARPDPPEPPSMAVRMTEDWIFGSGTLWSELKLLGAGASEVWNDAPRATAGSQEVEIWAWENLNAFVARLSTRGVTNFYLRGVWALRDAAEGWQREGTRELADRGIKGEIEMRRAEVWLRVAGRAIWAKAEEVEGEDNVDIETLAGKLPWRGSATISRGRWRFIRRRLCRIAEMETREATKSSAAELAGLMQQIEAGS